jgi:3-dehydroquinate dehydratase II
MKKMLLIHGPNLNRLGKRDPTHYGALTLSDLEARVRARAVGHEVLCFQSNHEGALIDFIQEHSDADGILINPGALTHSSYALHDALLDSGMPCVEVHLSDVQNREAWRAISITAPACLKSFYGKQEHSYEEALDFLLSQL